MRINRRQKRMLFAPLALVLAVMSIGPVSGAPARSFGRFDQGGLEGSRTAVMQTVNVPARVSIVATIPGKSEAWAIGRSTAKVPGWAGERAGGQTVFLRYTTSTGWRMIGPPHSTSGEIQNPRLTSLSLAPNGEGWAVGDRGAMYRLIGTRWIASPAKTTSSLRSVSIGSDRQGTYGFALADGPAALRLAGDAWSVESIQVPGGEKWDLESISAVSPHEAWAVGSASRGVLILHRTSSGWGGSVATGNSLFDERENPRRAGQMVVAATRAHSVSAHRDGAWIGGTLVPVDVASDSLGDPSGDASRPFVLHYSAGRGFVSYCPDQYSLGTGGAETTTICDAPFPLSGFGISDIQAFRRSGGDEVFAGGLGLFHFRNGSWVREPNGLSYLSNVSLSSPREGWVAGTGTSVGGAGTVSSIATLGHWTRSPRPSRVARWPEPVTHPFEGVTQALESVALAPDGSGRAFAVGQAGAAMIYSPGVGWDSYGPVSQFALHAAAWPGPTGFAVGRRGSIFRFDGSGQPRQDPSSERVTTASLFGIAFTSPNRGYAVGSNGTIIRYRDGAWSVDPASLKLVDSDLYGIAAAGDEFVAAGADGTVIETRNGSWRRVSGLESLLSRGGSVAQGGQLPALYASAGLEDGTVFLGGELSTLIRRDGERGEWKIDTEGDRVPPEGTILALAARRAGGGFDLFASVSYDTLKYSGETPSALTGFLLHGTPRGWEDVQFGTLFSTYSTFDASGLQDPVYSIAFDGSRAWAVGGAGAGNDDGQGHVQAYPTSVVYRVDLNGDPKPQGHAVTPVLETSPSLVSFAYFGESACGKGLCSVSIGSGTKADVVAAQIQREINAMAKLPGGPKFVIFGGGMRRTGIPEELGQFKKFIDGFDIPVFAALGQRDLFRGLQPSALDDVNDFGSGAKEQAQVQPDALFYSSLFDDRPRPWGTRGRDLSPTFRPVSPGQSNGGARTHYAFDYAPDGSAKLRVVVLDDSAPGRLTNPTTQNPERNQTAWLQEVLGSSSAPSIIVMNRPARDPLDLSRPRTYPDAVSVQNVAAQVGASAVLTSFFRQNAVDVVKVEGVANTVPVYVFGGGGSPLESLQDPSKAPEPSFGYYHSWQVVSVDLSRKLNDFGQYETTVRSYPVVDTVSLHAEDGTTTRAGNTLRFVGAGHAPAGGGPGDPLQSKAVVLPFLFGTRGVCPPDARDANRPKCRGSGPIGPTFFFQSEDTSVGEFVTPDAVDPRKPYRDADGKLVPDSTSGLFCAVGAGTTFVNVVSGFHRSRMQVTVDGGFGPCVEKPIPPLPRPRPPVPGVDPPLEKSVNQPLFHPVTDQSAVSIVPPPPVPVVAPAPPAAGGFARKEQHEEAHEDAGQKFTALSRPSRYDPVTDVWPVMIGGIVLALALAVIAGKSVVKSRTPGRSWMTVEYPSGRRRR